MIEINRNLLVFHPARDAYEVDYISYHSLLLEPTTFDDDRPHTRDEIGAGGFENRPHSSWRVQPNSTPTLGSFPPRQPRDNRTYSTRTPRSSSSLNTTPLLRNPKDPIDEIPASEPPSHQTRNNGENKILQNLPRMVRPIHPPHRGPSLYRT